MKTLEIQQLCKYLNLQWTSDTQDGTISFQLQLEASSFDQKQLFMETL